MNLIGNKVILRGIEIEDADLLLELINDPETEYLLGGWSFPVSSIKQKEWIQKLDNGTSTLRCIIQDKDSGESVGTIILNKIDYKNGNAAIHIKIANGDYRGRGYGTDAVTTVIRYAFEELRLHCVYAQINSDNIGSQKLFSKCGFAEEAELKDRIYKKGNYLSVKLYSIFNEQI